MFNDTKITLLIKQEKSKFIAKDIISYTMQTQILLQKSKFKIIDQIIRIAYSFPCFSISLHIFLCKLLFYFFVDCNHFLSMLITWKVYESI